MVGAGELLTRSARRRAGVYGVYGAVNAPRVREVLDALKLQEREKQRKATAGRRPRGSVPGGARWTGIPDTGRAEGGATAAGEFVVERAPSRMVARRRPCAFVRVLA